MTTPRAKSLFHVAITEFKAAMAVAKNARIKRATARRLEWAIDRTSQAPPIDPTTPS